MRRIAALLLLGALASAGCSSHEAVPRAVAGDPASAPTVATDTRTSKPTGPPRVLAKGWCSKDLVGYMKVKSSTQGFERGFGRPRVIEGLDVGCAALSPKPSALGYIDTYAFVRRSPGVLATLRQRIRALGFTDGPNIFTNPAGDPEGFLFILGDPPDTAGKVFVDHDDWVVVQFYMPA